MIKNNIRQGGIMANPEACELYIDQQIEEGLEEGKTPYSIGKEMSGWILHTQIAEWSD
jgi:hypothetical protein